MYAGWLIDFIIYDPFIKKKCFLYNMQDKWSAYFYNSKCILLQLRVPSFTTRGAYSM